MGDAGISPLFLASVFVSAWYGGLGPGLLATLLSGVATAWLLIPEHGSLAGAGGAVLRVFVFTLVCLLVNSLNAATRRAAEAARAARIAADAANQSKSRFVAMVSHELRAPLTPVAMVAEALADDPHIPPAVRQDVRMMWRNIQLEMRLIDDLVDLTRLGAGKLNLRWEQVDLHQPLTASIRLLEPDARERQLELGADLTAEDTQVMGDSIRLQQIFWNLIRNALKFTPEGGRVWIRTSNPTGGSVCVEISDTGIGIDPERLSTIFGAFEQGDPDIAARFGGLGLGLAICQALTEAHHGTIKAASKGRDRGATMTFCIPTTRGSASRSATDGAVATT